MAKLGSHKRPAIIRVQTPERAQNLMQICYENEWQVIVGIEPDKEEDITDIQRLMNPPKPVRVEQAKKIGRNDPCRCGSGKKYKKCCFGDEVIAS